jgi:2'-5' RNA ligase
VRLFVAVFPPEPVRERIGTIRSALEGHQPGLAALRWVRPERCHLTMRFLGDREPSAVERLTGAIEAAVAGLSRFEVELAGLGCFPKPERARVLWLGTRAGREQLVALAARLESELAGAGVDPDDRPFQPHLTLARAGRRPFRLGRDPLPNPFASFMATELTLVESVLGGPDAGYHVRAAATLA